MFLPVVSLCVFVIGLVVVCLAPHSAFVTEEFDLVGDIAAGVVLVVLGVLVAFVRGLWLWGCFVRSTVHLG